MMFMCNFEAEGPILKFSEPSIFPAESGQCFTFGSNQFGQLGSGEEAVIDREVFEVLRDVDISMVSCGDTFTVVVSNGWYSVKADSFLFFSHDSLLL